MENFNQYLKKLKDGLKPIYSKEEKEKALKLIDIFRSKGGYSYPQAMRKAKVALKELQPYLTEKEKDHLAYLLQSSPTLHRFYGRGEDFDDSCNYVKSRIQNSRAID